MSVSLFLLCVHAYIFCNSDDEAVAMVKEAASKDLEGAWCSGNLIAKALVDEATRRGSGDNLSAVVVFF